ncbi:MAG: hypothetical protein EBX52_10750 [Proteobacteria bacterium]|nr:hypothetical protein [Pseudomonadota bacterium]
MKLVLTLLVGLTFSAPAFSGTPDQDPKVKKLRALFRSASAACPHHDLSIPSDWTCTSHDAFRDDFYSENNMTFRFSQEAWEERTFSNHGSIIFKELEFTPRGIQSVKPQAAYSDLPVHLVLRPVPGKNGPLLIGEVSVQNEALPQMSRYYGYDRVLSGVPSVLDSSRTVYFYLTCKQTGDR